ncbi:MAG: alkaline phosphatase, partial [Gammaproteobacteria bacterium]
YAHIMDRDFESDANGANLANPGDCADIARQLIEFRRNVIGSDGLEVALGGGRANFIPAATTDPEYGSPGLRLDNRDLTGEWQQQHENGRYVWNKQQFDDIDPDTTDHLLGLFEPSHMQYELDREDAWNGEPSLSEMTRKAIQILQRNDNGYYLNIEAGRIDHGHHATNPIRALTDAIEFSNAIRTAYEMVDMEETLIIVTADHSHVFTIAGYPARGNPILGKVLGLDRSGEPRDEFSLASDGLPYTTLGYINGRGYHDTAEQRGSTRIDLTEVDTEAESFWSETLVPLPAGAETHGGEDVAIYAAGPGSDLIRGVMEQHVIFHVMLEANQ